MLNCVLFPYCLACRAGLEAAFDPAVGLVAECLGVALDGETARGLADGLERLAEADQREPGPAGEAAPAYLVMEVDGVLVHERDAWHVAKAAKVAPLGPATRVDLESGREQLAMGPT